MKNRKILWIFSVITLTGAITVFMGNGCSKEFTAMDHNGSAAGGSSAQDSSAGGSVGAGSGVDNTINVIPGAKTASLVYSNQILDHLSSCVGVAVPSTDTVAMYNQKKGAISVNGEANTITAPMMMSIISIAGEVCNDLINQDDKKGANALIFKGFSMTSTSLPSASLINDAISRLALSCWQRHDTSSERQIILNMLPTIGSNQANATRQAALMMCTTVLSSLDAILN